MQATARRSWRTRPQYTGHVADGYYQDSEGRIHFQPNPQDDVDLRRAKLFLLDLDDDLPPVPAVVPVPIGGRMPSPRAVEMIRKAVDQIPLRFREKWLAAGGRIEVIPGGALPDSRWLGANKFGSARARVAGDHPDSCQTARHEFAHGLDHALGYVSHSGEWLRIWQAAKTAGKVPSFAGQREKPEEFFAEEFARLWHPTLFIVSRAAQDFILGLA
jgi:hypothetical protein